MALHDIDVAQSAERARFAAKHRSDHIRQRRYDWLLASASMAAVGYPTFERLCGIWFLEPHAILIDPREHLLEAISGYMDAFVLQEMSDDAEERAGSPRHQAFESDLALVASLSGLQCICLVEALQQCEVHDGADHEANRQESYRRMQAMATPEGREVVALKAEIERLRQIRF